MTTSTLTTRSLVTVLTDLRNALTIDAIVTGANGIAYIAAAPLLAGVLGIPGGALRAIGAFLVVYALAVWAIRIPRRISSKLSWSVVAANAVWAATSVGVAVTGWHSPTAVGTIWIVAQAVVVAGFAELQITALRRRRSKM